MDQDRNDKGKGEATDESATTNEEFSYDGLCISSGGYKGVASLGALALWDLHGYFKRVKWWSGCSVGAIISLLMACGWTPIALYKNIVHVKLFSGMGDIDFEKFKTSYGLVSNDLIREELEKLVLMKRSKIPTFLDLYKESKYLAFSVTDRRTKRGYKIDYLSDPNLLVTEGALMSANIPFIFQPIEFKGMEIVDGALTNPLPIDYIDNGKRRILAVSLFGETSEEKSFVNFLSDTLMIQIEEMQRISGRCASRRVDLFEMMVAEISLMDTTTSYKAKNKLFFKGMDDARALVNVLTKKHKHRKDKPMKPTIRVPIKEIPEEVLIRCLLCQPVDVLCQSSISSEKTIKAALDKIPKDKLERLKQFARQIIMDEVKSGVYMKHEESHYETSQKVHIKENYSQKLYDTLPLQFKAAARVVMDSMSAAQANNTINGLNIVIEGLNRLGIDLIGGFMLGGPVLNVEDRRTTDEASKIEVIDDDETKTEAKPRNAMDDVD